MRSNANENAKKYYYRGKGSIGVNDGRRRTKIPVPRAAAGFARQLKIPQSYFKESFACQIILI